MRHWQVCMRCDLPLLRGLRFTTIAVPTPFRMKVSPTRAWCVPRGTQPQHVFGRLHRQYATPGGVVEGGQYQHAPRVVAKVWSATSKPEPRQQQDWI
jgi:hypothetical protein